MKKISIGLIKPIDMSKYNDGYHDAQYGYSVQSLDSEYGRGYEAGKNAPPTITRLGIVFLVIVGLFLLGIWIEETTFTHGLGAAIFISGLFTYITYLVEKFINQNRKKLEAKRQILEDYKNKYQVTDQKELLKKGFSKKLQEMPLEIRKTGYSKTLIVAAVMFVLTSTYYFMRSNHVF